MTNTPVCMEHHKSAGVVKNAAVLKATGSAHAIRQLHAVKRRRFPRQLLESTANRVRPVYTAERDAKGVLSLTMFCLYHFAVVVHTVIIYQRFRN